MPAQLQRDSFARASLMREVAQHRGTSHSCDWCGQTGRTLYRYWWETDSRSRRPLYGREFCSVGCWRSYSS